MNLEIPPLSPVHRERWQRLGGILTQLRPKAEGEQNADATPAPTPTAQSNPVANPPLPAAAKESLGVKSLPPQLVATARPVPIFSVDLKKERAGLFFQHLNWKQGVTEAQPEYNETFIPRDEITAWTTRSFFSRKIPWGARGQTPPDAPEDDPGMTDSLDLSTLMQAATQQAIHTSRKAASRPAALGSVAQGSGAAQFFQSLHWNERQPHPTL